MELYKDQVIDLLAERPRSKLTPMSAASPGLFNGVSVRRSLSLCPRCSGDVHQEPDAERENKRKKVKQLNLEESDNTQSA